MRMITARRMSPRSPQTPTNLSVRAHLVRRARALGINLSEVLEAALEERLRQIEREAWARANQEAIGEYNERVAREGVFSDGWRRF
jgi:antitoxin CcdA